MSVWVNLGAAWAMMTPQAPLTLSEALQEAERKAFSLRIARTVIAKSKAQVREARGSKGIRVSADSTYTRFDREITSDFGSGSSVVRPIDAAQTVLQASMPLDFGGVLKSLVSAAQWSVDAATYDFEAERNTIRLNVRQAFFGVVQAEEAVKVFEEALWLAKERERVLEVQLKNGAIAKVDLLRAQAQRADAESSLLESQNNLNLAKAQLNLVLARPVTEPIDVAPEPVPATVRFTEAELGDIALKSRAEFKSLERQARVLGFVTYSRRSGLTPSLSVGLQYTKDWNAQGFGSSASTALANLTLNIPLYDSGVTRARIDQAKQDEEALKVRFEQFEQSVSLELRTAWLNYSNAVARLEVAERQLTAAEENYRLAALRGQAGEGINLEVVDAQNALTAARVGRVNALYGIRVAHAQIMRAVGTDDIGANSPQSEEVR